jgi:integrase
LRRKGGGSYYKRGSVWWVKWYRNGRPVRESTESTKESAAKDLLNRRLGAVAEGRPISLRAEKVRVGELLDDLLTEYRVNGRASLDRMEELVAHLRPVFGDARAAMVKTPEVRTYIDARQHDGAANATINRELAALKRAYSLGLQADKILVKPFIPTLEENNVRKGFFEREQFEAVRNELPDYLRSVMTFAYITGWRIPSEVLTREWRHVDFAAGTVRLDPGETKNREGRTFYMTPELRACLEVQKVATDEFGRKTGRIVPWVFWRRVKDATTGGHTVKPIRKFYTAWAYACLRAGLATKTETQQSGRRVVRITASRIPHDFRRTAVRALERAGVPRSVAMKMTGHKTESVYRRYAIVSDADLREAAAKLAQSADSERMGTKSASTGTVVAMAIRK